METIEGPTARGEIDSLQRTFDARNALQCVFCTPGMLIATAELLAERPQATRSEIREYLSGTAAAPVTNR